MARNTAHNEKGALPGTANDEQGASSGTALTVTCVSSPGNHLLESVYNCAIPSWRCAYCRQQLTQLKATRREEAQHAGRLVQRLQLQHHFSAWRHIVGRRARRHSQDTAAVGLHSQRVLRRALGGWRYLAWFKQTARDVFSGRQLQLQAVALQVGARGCCCSMNDCKRALATLPIIMFVVNPSAFLT